MYERSSSFAQSSRHEPLFLGRVRKKFRNSLCYCAHSVSTIILLRVMKLLEYGQYEDAY